MSSKFRKVKLCEILSFKTGKLDSNAAVDNGCYPFFTCSPVTLSINTYAFDTEAVLLAGNNANGVFSVKYHNGKFNAYQRTYIITPLNNSEVNVKWLYFRIKYVTSELQSMSVGTATKFLTKKILDAFEIELPTFEEQTYQAKILWGLQDKLANNEAINQTLEQMAQALFKSWFVDFEPVKAKIAVLEAGGSQEDATLAAMTAISGKDTDALAVFEREHPEQYTELKATAELFPSAMQESELGDIPEGWESSPLSEKIKLIGGGTPKRSEPEYWNGDICWYSVKDAPAESDVYVINTAEKITKKGLDKSSTKLLPAGTTIISARGTVGKLALTATEMAMNQSCYGISGGEFSGPLLTYLKVKQCVDVLKRNTHGAVFDTITTSTFETVTTLTASKITNHQFEKIVNPLFSAIESNLRTNASLTQLRDTLLPKLLSGEITLPEAEQAVSEAENV
ncbi:restriction endonuclease subunit S [Leclercia adecarboxylata]|uniref:restriction endonuclease subunit S n=1 Tax=Leclercia adecarboxylata TaxID=83655 RepID=UPI0009079DC1|nr:restriction endonuclease subunit S [Leclercia adecarboxylata]